MTIRSSDIKLMASERLYDEDDGGGKMSAVEVRDGVVNNLFPDISRLDRAYGRVNLRKGYAQVGTNSKETLYGAHAIITRAPQDPNVSAVMFSTKSFTDERKEARERIESYLAASIDSEFILLGTQLRGQRSIACYSRSNAVPPQSGDVFVLRTEDKSGNLTGAQQYIRIIDIESEMVAAEASGKTTTYISYVLKISAALTDDFIGFAAPVFDGTKPAVKIRHTQVADASNYYGVVPLALPVTKGSTSIRTEGIFGQLVPSATAEIAIVDNLASADSAVLVKAGEPYTITATVSASSLHFGKPVIPGSIEIADLIDNGQGELVDVSDNKKADIDYRKGEIKNITGLSGTIAITATPAVEVVEKTRTKSDRITEQTQGLTYIKTLAPTPIAMSLKVDYMAQGRWYTMQDMGGGTLADGFGGVGTLNYTTGTVTLSLSALPDIDTEILYSWVSSQTIFEVVPPTTNVRMVAIEHTTEKPIEPGTLQLTYYADSVLKTVGDDGEGNLTGDAQGSVNYTTGEIVAYPPKNYDKGSSISASYYCSDDISDSFTADIVGGDLEISLGAEQIASDTINLEIEFYYTGETYELANTP